MKTGQLGKLLVIASALVALCVGGPATALAGGLEGTGDPLIWVELPEPVVLSPSDTSGEHSCGIDTDGDGTADMCGDDGKHTSEPKED